MWDAEVERLLRVQSLSDIELVAKIREGRELLESGRLALAGRELLWDLLFEHERREPAS